jgi:hypothetical protein
LLFENIAAMQNSIKTRHGYDFQVSQPSGVLGGNGVVTGTLNFKTGLQD